MERLLFGCPFLDRNPACALTPLLELGVEPVRSACMVWKKDEELAMSLRFGRGFRASTTSLIRGLAFGSRLRQCAANWAAFCAPLIEKRPSRRGSSNL